MPHVPRHGRTRSTHRRQTRSTHDHSGYLPAITGAEEVYEQVSIDEVPASPVIVSASSPQASLDFTPPATPTGLTLTSDTGLDADGRTVLRLKATLVQPPDSDLFASYVEVTAENDEDPVSPQPIWTNPANILIGVEATTGAIEGVRGRTRYWARAYAVDQTGNRSPMTGVVDHTTARDTDAPSVPQSFVAAGGFKAIGAHWSASAAPDLMFFELRYAPDDGSGSGPNTGQWSILRVRTNTVWVDGLTIGQKYWAQVRAVDFSGNVATSVSDATAVDYLQNPEAGWTALASATPVAVGAADVAFNTVITNILNANRIDAGTITTGILKVNVTDGGMADGIEVYSGATRIAKWDENGLYIGKNTAGLPADLSGSDYVRVTDAGLTVYRAGIATSAVTPDGINATAINFGVLPGGHNLIKNSSFELADFGSAVSNKTWDVAADWTGTQQSNTNVTNGANSLTQTASSY